MWQDLDPRAKTGVMGVALMVVGFSFIGASNIFGIGAARLGAIALLVGAITIVVGFFGQNR